VKRLRFLAASTGLAVLLLPSAAAAGLDVDAPEAPSIEDTPELETPELGELETPELGELNAPELGELETPELGELNAPELGELETPELGELNAPELEAPQADSSSTEPNSAEPDSAEPDSAEPDSAEPDSAEPDSAEPDSAGTDLSVPELPELQTPQLPGFDNAPAGTANSGQTPAPTRPTVPTPNNPQVQPPPVPEISGPAELSDRLQDPDDNTFSALFDADDSAGIETQRSQVAPPFGWAALAAGGLILAYAVLVLGRRRNSEQDEHRDEVDDEPTASQPTGTCACATTSAR